MTDPDHRESYLKQAKRQAAPARTASRHTRGQVPDTAGPTSGPQVERLLELIADRDRDRDVRLEAIRRLQALSFSSGEFQRYTPAYIAALREIATDPDAQVRRDVLDILALRRDEYAQRLLVAGLEGESKALVPARVAVKLLGYDQHAAPRELLLRIGTESTDTTLRRHALRQLTADGEAANLFRQVASDPDEDPEIRRIGLVALQSLDPEAFGDIARKVVVDDGAEDDLRAASLTALANDIRATPTRATHEQLHDAVRDVRDKTESHRLTRAADSYLDAVQRSR